MLAFLTHGNSIINLQIEEWIQSLDAIDIATVSTIGQSSEGRNLYMVKVSTGAGPGGNPKPAIFLDSNLHAREWISGAVGTWILNELTSKNPEYDSFLEAFDFYTVPMANPDGYEYSHTTDRLWRKTRSVNAGSTCRGCDPNRNFGFHFGMPRSI
jgi:murein tripeptide amidase MpaA